jgi:hypothetical protein
MELPLGPLHDVPIYSQGLGALLAMTSRSARSSLSTLLMLLSDFLGSPGSPHVTPGHVLAKPKIVTHLSLPNSIRFGSRRVRDVVYH